MNKIFVLLLFIVCSLHLLAKESQIDFPKLNLEIGKTYTIETITHMDTTKFWSKRIYNKTRYLLTPTNYSEKTQIYSVNAKIDYHKYVEQVHVSRIGWKEDQSYESGLIKHLRTPLQYIDDKNVSFAFKVSKYGKVIKLDLDSLQVFYKKSSLKFTEKNKKFFFDEIQKIFFQIPNNVDDDACGDKYNVVDVIDSVCHVELQVDKNTLGFGGAVKTLNYYLDQRTGLPVRAMKVYSTVPIHLGDRTELDGNHTVYYERLMPELEDSVCLDVKEFYDRNYNELWIKFPNTLVRGSLGNELGMRNVMDVVLYEEQRNRKIIFEANEENNYEIPLKINDACKIKLGSYFIITPGTDLSINLTATDKKSYKGTKYVTLKDISTSAFPCDYQKIGKGIDLLKIRDTKSPEIYLWLYNTKLYSELNLTRTPLDEYAKNVVVNNSLATNTETYFKFLDTFIERFPFMVKNMVSNDQMILDTRNYERPFVLGDMLLSEPIKTYYFGRQLLLKDTYSFYRYLPELVSRFHEYKETREKYFNMELLERMYNKIQKVQEGEIAPDFTEKDIYGKEITLSKFRGKVVYLNFLSLRDKNSRYNTRPKLTEYEKFYKNDDFAFFNLIIGDTSNWTKDLKKLPEKVYNIFLEEDFEQSGIESYIVNRSYSDYLIGKDGKIKLSGRTGRKSDITNKIEAAINEPYDPCGKSILLIVKILLGVIVFTVVGGFTVFKLLQSRNKRRLQKSELNKRMRELELTAIRSQMNPHFMYNCLNSIQNLVQKKQNDEAHLYLSKFASLIRFTLNQSAKNEISLHEEFESIQQYIELEKLRFDFEYITQFDDKLDVFTIMVPPMLLQPFVENAILHGLAPKESNAKLKVATRLIDNKICITIEDNGVGRAVSAENQSKGNGKGIGFTRERLKLLSEKYNTEFNLEIVDLEDEKEQACGTRIEICFGDEV